MEPDGPRSRRCCCCASVKLIVILSVLVASWVAMLLGYDIGVMISPRGCRVIKCPPPCQSWEHPTSGTGPGSRGPGPFSDLYMEAWPIYGLYMAGLAGSEVAGQLAY